MGSVNVSKNQKDFPGNDLYLSNCVFTIVQARVFGQRLDKKSSNYFPHKYYLLA